MKYELKTQILNLDGSIAWDSEEDEKTTFVGDEPEIVYIASLAKDGTVDMSNVDIVDAIVDKMLEYVDIADARYRRLDAIYDDLRECRKHASTLVDFREFTNAIDDVSEKLGSNALTLANDIKALMHRTFDKALSLSPNTEWFGLSIVDKVESIDGFKVIWSVKEIGE